MKYLTSLGFIAIMFIYLEKEAEKTFLLVTTLYQRSKIQINKLYYLYDDGTVEKRITIE